MPEHHATQDDPRWRRDGRTLADLLAATLADDDAHALHAAELFRAVQLGVQSLAALDEGAAPGPGDVAAGAERDFAAYADALDAALRADVDALGPARAPLVERLHEWTEAWFSGTRVTAASLSRVRAEWARPGAPFAPRLPAAAPPADRWDYRPDVALHASRALTHAHADDPDGLLRMLRGRARTVALAAIGGLGARAGFALPTLLAELDAAAPRPQDAPYADARAAQGVADASAALGRIAADDDAALDALLDRLTGPRRALALAAADALSAAGVAAARDPRTVAALDALSEACAPHEWLGPVEALASVAPGDDRAVLLVLRLAESGLRCRAIDAMGGMAPAADRVLPHLLDALETFEEYDPDYTHSGSPHERVFGALRRLGPAAAPAAARVAARLTDPEGELDIEAVKCLAAMGPGAAVALPALYAARERYADDWSDVLDAAIADIGGPSPPAPA